MKLPLYVRVGVPVIAALAVGFQGQARSSVASVRSLTNELQQLHREWEAGASGAVEQGKYERFRTGIQKRMRDEITAYVSFRLKTGDADPARLESQLTRALNTGLKNSWADHPAYVFALGSDNDQTLVVAFTLDEAAGGSTSVIQVYRGERGSLELASEAGREMNGCNMHIIPIVSPAGEHRLFAFGNIFGANQAISKGVLYAIRDSRLMPIWRTKDSLGLRARSSGDRLVLEYRDARKFYQRVLPDAFRDVYAQTDTGVELASRKPLGPESQ